MNKPIEVLVTGDFYGGYRIEKLIMEDNHRQIFNDFLPHIQDVDLAITNLESPLIEKGIPITKTGPAIKSIPETIKALKFAGFNLLTLANNHIMDYGAEGLSKTIDLCNKSGIATLGAGMNYIEASNTFYIEINGIKLAFINVAENEWSTTDNDKPGANPLNPIANFYAIREASKQADYVFVIVHGGHEMYELPSPRMKETYRFFIDCGASAIIGHHTHCYSGYEVYKGCPIFYSLGNFIFDWKTEQNQEWHMGFAVKFKINNNVLGNEIIPYVQCVRKPGVFLLNEYEYNQFKNRLDNLNQIIDNDSLLKKEFLEYCNRRVKNSYNAYLEPHSNRIIQHLQSKGFVNSFLSKRKRLLYNNLIRCESHKDVVLEILKKHPYSD